MRPSRDIGRLIEIMAALRTPVTGCPWDLEQDFSSIAPYTVEEAYEVADAIQRGDMDDLREELGDLLLQVVYHARMAEEAGVPRNLFGFFKMGGQTRAPAPPSRIAGLRSFARKATYWAPARVFILRTIGNRLHRRWRMGSFDVQIGAAKMVERYRRALFGFHG